MIFTPKRKLEVNFYADEDFAGLYNCEDTEIPICVKSRTGYVITSSDCILWVSNIQTKMDLSTLHFEYVALYQTLNNFLPLKNCKI